MRKQLAVKILPESFDKLEQIKQETGLSNAKIIEMLLDSYTNTNTNTNIEERVYALVQKALDKYVNTNTNIKEEEEEELYERFDDTDCYYNPGNGVADAIEAREWAMINAMKPENQKIDPNDPIEKMIREQEELYGNSKI